MDSVYLYAFRVSTSCSIDILYSTHFLLPRLFLLIYRFVLTHSLVANRSNIIIQDHLYNGSIIGKLFHFLHFSLLLTLSRFSHFILNSDGFLVQRNVCTCILVILCISNPCIFTNKSISGVLYMGGMHVRNHRF